MTLNEMNGLLIFERKIVRKIFGPKIGQLGEFERRSNQEIMNLLGGESIVKFVKAQRLRWLGHLTRMNEDRAQKRVQSAIVHSGRKKGRPRLRWIDCAGEDLKAMGVCNWKRLAGDRVEWRRIVDQAKAHTGL